MHSVHKVALIGINSAWYQSNPTLFALRQAIADTDCESVILEYSGKDLTLDIISSIVAAKPDVMAFSAYIWNRDTLLAIIPELHKLLPEALIVLGGPEALRLRQDLALACVAISGAGEGAFRKLALEGFNIRDGIMEVPAPHIKALPLPYTPADAEDVRGKLLYYESSRGCPFTCAFCLSATDTRNEQRFEPSDPHWQQRFIADLDTLCALSPKTIKFVDRTFNLQPAIARGIWSIIAKHEPGCEYHFEIVPELLTEADIAVLREVPDERIRFETGIQSIDPVINHACGRRGDWEKTRRMLQALTFTTKVVVHADLMAGLPGQRYTDVLESVDALAEVFPHEIQLGMLKVLPDTPMREIAIQRGFQWLDHAPYTVLSTDGMGFAQLRECEALARVINLYWNKGEFCEQWRDLLRSHKATEVLLALREYHHQHAMNLHSISKQHRAEVFQAAVQMLNG